MSDSKLGGDPRFHELTRQMSALHAKKAADYGAADDILCNFHRAERIGIEPWRACLSRLSDKWVRMEVYATKGTLANEGVEDTLIDIANLAILTLILHRETATIAQLKEPPRDH